MCLGGGAATVLKFIPGVKLPKYTWIENLRRGLPLLRALNIKILQKHKLLVSHKLLN